jgi:hypothetical protein
MRVVKLNINAPRSISDEEVQANVNTTKDRDPLGMTSQC